MSEPNGTTARQDGDPPTENINRAVKSFRAGEPILLHDSTDREGEVDLLLLAAAATPDAIARLRIDGGGLLWVAVTDEIAEIFDLPYLHDVIDHPSAKFNNVGYDLRPSFSLTINHRKTRTGITDNDRSRTVRAVAEAAANPERITFASKFRAPGHVHVLRGAQGLLSERQGHTEFGLALAKAAGCTPAVVGIEMLDDQSGEALSPVNARAYASDHDLVYLEGSDVLERFT